MNHHQWSQRLRGHINLKLCLGLGAVALAGAFVIKLPAQQIPARHEKGCATCGDSTNSVTKQATLLDSTVHQPTSWATAGVISNTDIGFTGRVSGLFYDDLAQKPTQEELSFNELKGHHFLPQSNYVISCDIHSIKANRSYFAMGKRGVLFGVQFDRGVANATAKFSFAGSDVEKSGIKLQSSSNRSLFPVINLPVVKSDDGESFFKGSISGGFADGSGKLARRKLNIADTTKFLPLGGLFDFSGQFSAKDGTPLRFAGLINTTRKTDSLSVLTTEPFSSVQLISSIDGKEFMSDDFSHKAVSAEKIEGILSKSLKKVSRSTVSSPTLSLALYNADQSPYVRFCQAQPTTAPQPTATPKQGGDNPLKVIVADIFGLVGDALRKNHAVDATVGNMERTSPNTFTEKESSINTCEADPPDKVSGHSPSFNAKGWNLVSGGRADGVKDDTPNNDGIRVITNWQAKFPLSIGDGEPTPLGPYDAKSGIHRMKWTQEVGHWKGVVTITYSNNTSLPYNFTGTQYQDPTGVPLGTTPCPTPTLTPTPDPEDLNHNGIPDYKESTPTGTSTLVAPTPLAQP